MMGVIAGFLGAQLPFDILVNNAGTNKPSPFVDVKVEDFDFVFSLNVRAAYFVAQAVARPRKAEC